MSYLVFSIKIVALGFRKSFTISQPREISCFCRRPTLVFCLVWLLAHLCPLITHLPEPTLPRPPSPTHDRLPPIPSNPSTQNPPLGRLGPANARIGRAWPCPCKRACTCLAWPRPCNAHRTSPRPCKCACTFLAHPWLCHNHLVRHSLDKALPWHFCQYQVPIFLDVCLSFNIW